LVRRTVFSVAHSVVSENEKCGQLHQGRESNSGPCVIAEDEERSAEGPELREREPVHNRSHSVLPDAVMQVFSFGTVGLEISGAFVLQGGLVRRSQIPRAA